ncbi:hypothetical protein [Xanthobacter sp. YC-JY1]|uniref:hypothetical protein n=1 Tax=Xanthobacter sp. YC-JY1 TaxID=2419844 RepID=UPI001F1D5280|nr:hypothetical protein [Xanthobacter sp. YC-JY1]UJX45749.1 hypothetical protein D7006_14240 [Xanthobacter sp. YC-JY1]
MTEDLNRDLGRLEGKVDAIYDTAERIEARLSSQDDRIASLEKRQWYLTGAAAAAAWIATNFIDLKAALAALIR